MSKPFFDRLQSQDLMSDHKKELETLDEREKHYQNQLKNTSEIVKLFYGVEARKQYVNDIHEHKLTLIMNITGKAMVTIKSEADILRIINTELASVSYMKDIWRDIILKIENRREELKLAIIREKKIQKETKTQRIKLEVEADNKISIDDIRVPLIEAGELTTSAITISCIYPYLRSVNYPFSVPYMPECCRMLLRHQLEFDQYRTALMYDWQKALEGYLSLWNMSFKTQGEYNNIQNMIYADFDIRSNNLLAISDKITRS